MPDVVRSPKNKRPAPWLIISILIVVIALTAVAVNPALRQNLNKSERVTNLILQLQGLDYRLTALEWQSVNMGRLASNIVERVQSTRKEMQGIVGELEQLDPGSESLKSIRQAFTAYDSAVIKEFELITIGDLKQARSMDVEQVDPTFKVLGQALAQPTPSIVRRRDRLNRQSTWALRSCCFLSPPQLHWYSGAPKVRRPQLGASIWVN
jgi:hypothetical protein